MENLAQHLSNTWSQAYAIWIAGGWAMIAIAFTALVMFGLGIRMSLNLLEKRTAGVREKTWREWLDHPERRRGEVGALLDAVDSCADLKDVASLFEQTRVNEVAPFDRDLRVMKTCVGIAPLLGLLGTVTGMLTTFAALASGSGGDKTMSLVAQGISEALITTETGLVIALAGLFFQYQLARMHDRYKAFLAHLETACVQRRHRLRTTPGVGSIIVAPAGSLPGAGAFRPEPVGQPALVA